MLLLNYYSSVVRSSVGFAIRPCRTGGAILLCQIFFLILPTGMPSCSLYFATVRRAMG